jgi:hypothetical protein
MVFYCLGDGGVKAWYLLGAGSSLGLLGLQALAAGGGLRKKGLLTGLLRLDEVDVLHEDLLGLEDVTLALLVELLVEVAVNLGLSAVLGQEATEDAHAADPHDLGGEAGLAGTTALTVAAVAALGLGLGAAVDAEAGVDDVGLLDDVAVLDQLADILA